MIRPASFIVLAGLALTACGGGEQTTSGAGDPYAGFDAEIAPWGADLEATHPQCAAKVAGKGCEAFEVTCKGARDLTAADQAKGVTGKIIAAMTFRSTSAQEGGGETGSAFAEFSRAKGAWTRAEAKGVNLATCAAF